MAMEVVCVEECFLSGIWGFLQNLKSFVEQDAECSDLKLSAELGRFGSLIVTCSWWSLYRHEVDMRRNMCVSQNKLWVMKKYIQWKSEVHGSLQQLRSWKSRIEYFHVFQMSFSRGREIFAEVRNHRNYSKNSSSYLYRKFSILKNFQCHFMKKEKLVPTCFSIMTADCISLKDCSMVFRLNCKFPQKNAA